MSNSNDFDYKKAYMELIKSLDRIEHHIAVIKWFFIFPLVLSAFFLLIGLTTGTLTKLLGIY